MVKGGHRPGHAVRNAGVVLRTLACHWLSIRPVATQEIGRWATRAARIPDAKLRKLAQHTLAHERLNSEGAALFAVLAPAQLRTSLVQLLVRFQLMYDYIDLLTEQEVPHAVEVSRRVHCALSAALGEAPPLRPFYTEGTHGDDGGYLDELVAGCRELLTAFPSTAVVATEAIEIVQRSAEGQSQSHAAVFTTSDDLVRWATAASAPSLNLRWWETAAASESSLAIHALLASAAHPGLTPDAAKRIIAAYWPWITGLNALLDDVVDRAEDAAEGTHSYVDNYSSADEASDRLATIARRATAQVRLLPNSRQHAVILAAMTSFYLAAPGARAPDAQLVARKVRAELDVDVRLLVAMLRLRRRFGGAT